MRKARIVESMMFGLLVWIWHYASRPMHYPFENKDLFEMGFPQVHGLDQTRGWFYMTVLSSTVTTSPPLRMSLLMVLSWLKTAKKCQNDLKTTPHLMH